MSRLIRLDETGHTELARWTPTDLAAHAGAQATLRAELERGYFAVRMDPSGDGGTAVAEQVRDLPADAELVILRRPIAGG